MNKERVEFLSDGVFAIVMTLLTVEIGITADLHAVNDIELWHKLVELFPLFAAYFVSFNVLAMFWLGHNFFFHSITKTIDRILVLFNFIFLSFITLIPFCAKLVGEYHNSVLATTLYGLNLLIISVMMQLMYAYALRSKEVDSHVLTSRLRKQALIRRMITTGFTIFGLISVWVSIPLALFFYVFPIVFNIVPGLLDKLERIFGFELS